MSTYHD